MGIDPVVHIAGLSRRTVYDLFPGGTPELILAAHQAAIDYSLAPSSPRSTPQGDWASGSAPAIDAYARLLRSSDAVGPPSVGDRVARRASRRPGDVPRRLRAAHRAPRARRSGRARAAQAMLDVVNGATRRALRDGDGVADRRDRGDRPAPGSLGRPRSARRSPTRRGFAAPCARGWSSSNTRPGAARSDARERLERLSPRPGSPRRPHAVAGSSWRWRRAHVDGTSRDGCRDSRRRHLPHALHFGVPLAGAMRLA